MFPPKGQFVCGQQWSFTKHYSKRTALARVNTKRIYIPIDTYRSKHLFCFGSVMQACILMSQKQKKNPELVDVAFNKLLYRFDI